MVLFFGFPNQAHAAAVSFANANQIVINDDAAATPYPSTISVVGLSGPATKVTASISGFSHTSSADVSILLVGPQGQTVVLLSQVGGGTSVSSVNLTFDDSAPTGLQPFGQITSGTYRPTNGQLDEYILSSGAEWALQQFLKHFQRHQSKRHMVPVRGGRSRTGHGSD